MGVHAMVIFFNYYLLFTFHSALLKHYKSGIITSENKNCEEGGKEREIHSKTINKSTRFLLKFILKQTALLQRTNVAQVPVTERWN